MQQEKYVIHDMDGTIVVFDDYDLYIEHFKTVYKPEGLGTRWKYNKITRKWREVHMDLVIV